MRKFVLFVSIMSWLLVSCDSSSELKYYTLTNAKIIIEKENSQYRTIANYLNEQLSLRSNLNFPINLNNDDANTPIIRLAVGNDRIPSHLTPAKSDESYAIWTSCEKNNSPVIHVVGTDFRGLLFGVGKLIGLTYLSDGYASISSSLEVTASPSDQLRAQQIISNAQGEDGFKDWDHPLASEQFVNDMVIFGANGFEPTRPELIDKYLEALGLDLFVKLKCDEIIELNQKEDEQILSFFDRYVGIDQITTYGGDASGSEKPQLFFPYLDRVIPLIQQGTKGAKWWYSNQCLADHAKDYDNYIFDFIQSRQPDYLYGMVYGPWTKRGITEIRKDLPQKYQMRHFPDICHPRWCQYPVPEWDRIFAVVWPRNHSIYAMPSMMLDIYSATRENTMGSLPYNHTGTYNDLNKFAWAAAGWKHDITSEELLLMYARVFFAHDFIKLPYNMDAEQITTQEQFIDSVTHYVAQGLALLEKNWTGQLLKNTSTEKALTYWETIADCIGGTQNNWRVEMFLYKARIDAQIKRKFDYELALEDSALQLISIDNAEDINSLLVKVNAVFEQIDNNFQSKDDFRMELINMGLSDRYGDVEEITNNIYTSFSDRYWIVKQLKNASSKADLLKIINYEQPENCLFYDNLGVAGEQAHLVRPKVWDEDPGFVYSPIEWVNNDDNSNKRHSQLTHALSRYDNPLMMQWDGLDKMSNYELRVVYNGPFDIKIKCTSDDGYLIHDFIEKEGESILTFSIPHESVQDGQLKLIWEQDTSDIMRGVSVTETWLMKYPK